MLLGSLYQILTSQQEDSSIYARIELNPEHPIFKGHFPDIPILPGVCQLQMMEEVLSTVLGKKMKVDHAAQMKFLSFVNPLVHPQFDIHLKIEKADDGLLLVQSNYIWDQTVFFKFKGKFNEYGGA